MFWDSSALVPTPLPAAESAALAALIASDEQARQRLATVMAHADIVAPTAPLRDRAGRLLAAHPLGAADALQLAAALA